MYVWNLDFIIVNVFNFYKHLTVYIHIYETNLIVVLSTNRSPFSLNKHNGYKFYGCIDLNFGYTCHLVFGRIFK